MRLYVAGPMSGLPDWNYPAFRNAEVALRSVGYDVESPHHLGVGDRNAPWNWYMRGALRQMLRCDAVALLPGWEQSRGATLEHHVATSLGMDAMPLSCWLAQTEDDAA